MQRLNSIVVGSLGLLMASGSLGHAKDAASTQPTPPADSFAIPPPGGVAVRRKAPHVPQPAALSQMHENPPVGPPPPNWVPQRHTPPLAYTPEGELVIITPAATALGSLSTSDRDLVAHFILASNGDLVLAKLAAQRATQVDTRDLAKRILRDEANAIAALRPLIEPRGVEISSARSESSLAEYERLTKSKGARFDKEYLQGQLQHHLNRVNLLRVGSEQGHDPLLHSWALRQVPTFERHLQTMRELLGLRSSGV